MILSFKDSVGKVKKSLFTNNKAKPLCLLFIMIFFLALLLNIFRECIFVKIDTNEESIQFEDSSFDEICGLSEEYSFMFYTILYSLYPMIKVECSPDEVMDYAVNTPYSAKMSIFDYVTDETNGFLVDMLVYYQDCFDSAVSVDVSGEVSEYKSQIDKDALNLEMSANEYLSKYYSCSEDSMINIVTKYFISEKYKNEVLYELSSNISEDTFEEMYLSYKNELDLYTFAVFSLDVSSLSDPDDVASLTDAVNNIYDNTHGYEDLVKLINSFGAEKPDAAFQFTPQTAYSYDNMTTEWGSLASYIMSDSLEPDTAALFQSANTLYIVYFLGRERNDNPTYNGTILSCENGDWNEVFSSLSRSNSTIHLSENSIFDSAYFFDTYFDGIDDKITLPYIFSLNDKVVYIESEGLPYYKSYIANVIYKEQCELIEETYSGLFEALLSA